MESLSDTPWDVVIEGTGLQQALLALALSRSNKKILHIDQNEYYGGAEAAFSLQEVEEWVEKLNTAESPTKPFRHATLWKSESEVEGKKLSFSRAYTLTLSPQIIYTKSKLLSQLVSSKVYKQLEFQAVGNWWIYDLPNTAKSTDEEKGALKRLPNGREDIFEDASIDNRSKRSLMKFLKFVVDYQSHAETWDPYANTNFPKFLTSQFKLPPNLQTVLMALTLSLDIPDETTVGYALPRIARHLTSIGVFGPGFGAVVPKWGGGAEIAQVACRAGAVGGGVYVLGTGIKSSQMKPENKSEVILSNGETVKMTYLASSPETEVQPTSDTKAVSKIIAVASSPLTSFFESSIAGSPLAAVSVIVFPPNTLDIERATQTHPVYIMAHSSETGECPAGQCVLYATSAYSNSSKALLEAALSKFLDMAETGEGKLLYNLYYEQEAAPSSLDLAFNDQLLDQVEAKWKAIAESEEADQTPFMQFEERTGMNDDENEDDNDNGY